MQRHLVLLLTILAIPMMGSQCRWGVAVDNSVPSKEQKAADADTGGLTVVVGTTAGMLEADDLELVAMAGQTFISSALTAAVTSLPAIEPTPSESPAGALEPLDLVRLPIASESERLSSPIPEPGGLLLFSIGFATVAYAGRRLRLARQPACSARLRTR